MSFDVELNGYPILVLIECDCSRDIVTAARVQEFANIVDDVQANKGIMISLLGFEQDAMFLAKEQGIALVTANAPSHIYCPRDEPSFSNRFFHAWKTDIIKGRESAALVLNPVNEKSLPDMHLVAGFCNLADLEWEHRPIIFEIVETGTPEPLPDGVIHLAGPVRWRIPESDTSATNNRESSDTVTAAVEDDPKEFEERVKTIIQRKFLPSDAGKSVVVHHRRRYRGRSSGHDHEIDVSFEISLGGIAVLVLVECKCYRRRVGIDDVLEFSARLEDIGAHKGVLVTTIGFQEGAKKVARAKGIALLTATTSHYEVVCRATGIGYPNHSARFFYSDTCQVTRYRDMLALEFQPVDENLQVELHYLVNTEELPPRGVDGFIAFEIVEPGSDSESPAGTIPLFSAVE